MTSERQAFIYVQLPGTLDTVPAALLTVQTMNDGMTVGRFRYGDRYLDRKGAIELDPFQLPLGRTVYEFTKLRGIPGAVRDGGPDGWGRRVIGNKLQRDTSDLEEIDYLLGGPQDGAGYLSFGGRLENTVPKRPVNRTHHLADLINTAHTIEEGKRVPQQLFEQLEPGTSMGGAKPKATIEDRHRLWLGKFPARNDRCNVQRIEFATLQLARRCGINACNARLESVRKRDVLLIERFDREYVEGGYRRVGFVSALTMLNYDDTFLDRERWSYLFLADQLRRWSTRPLEDRIELFRRMVFNAAVTNNDDHPRNHAVRRLASGWQLTPAYDIVPTALDTVDRRELAMTVGSYGRVASIGNLLSRADRFGLIAEAARMEIENVVAVVRKWREQFRLSGVSEEDIGYIAPAFLPKSFFAEKPPEG